MKHLPDRSRISRAKLSGNSSGFHHPFAPEQQRICWEVQRSRDEHSDLPSSQAGLNSAVSAACFHVMTVSENHRTLPPFRKQTSCWSQRGQPVHETFFSQNGRRAFLLHLCFGDVWVPVAPQRHSKLNQLSSPSKLLLVTSQDSTSSSTPPFLTDVTAHLTAISPWCHHIWRESEYKAYHRLPRREGYRAQRGKPTIRPSLLSPVPVQHKQTLRNEFQKVENRTGGEGLDKSELQKNRRLLSIIY